MKIVNHGLGIHEREVPGIDYFQKNLPEDWVGHTNLDLSLPQGPREIDVILFANDRIYLVDLKDGHGRYESKNGDWFLNGKPQEGRSPVKKILETARQVMILLREHLAELAKRTVHPKLPTPRIEGVVVLTGSSDLSGIAPTENCQVFTLKNFVDTVTDTRKRLARFAAVNSDFVSRPVNSTEWKPRLERFFNVRDGLFKEGMRHYGGYVVIGSGESVYEHEKGVYKEFNVQDDSAAQAVGLLRRWDFSKADTRFQTEKGRAEIAGRERKVIAWLNDRSTATEQTVLQVKAFDLEAGVDNWEVYERRRNMRRLSDFAISELPFLRPKERLELVRQMLSQAKTLHSYDAAHLDLGPHSVWVDAPSVVRFSHLMSARYPEANSLRESRYQFLSSVQTPEEALDVTSSAPQKDVYHLGCLMHLFLYERLPQSVKNEPPEWNSDVDPDGTYQLVYEVLERSLSWEASERFENASQMLDRFNSLLSNQVNGAAVLKRLERFKTVDGQMELSLEYPFKEALKKDNYVLMWLSEKAGERLVVKLWKRTSWSDGDSDYPRILDFLEKAQELSYSPPPSCVPIKSAIWLGDGIVITQLHVDGPNLAEHALMRDRAGLCTHSVLSFLLALVHSIMGMHDSGAAHGDLKPSNVLVTDEPFTPHFIDYHDFSCAADGEVQTSSYSPVKGGRFERDRFAVTVMCEEILDGLDITSEDLQRIVTAIQVCQGESPENATLHPLADALAKVLAPEPPKVIRHLSIGLPSAETGELLSDEGVFGYGFDRGQFFIRGATQAIFFRTKGSQIKFARISATSHLTNKILSLRQHGSLPLEIQVVGGVSNSFGDFQALFHEEPFAALLSGSEVDDAAVTERLDEEDQEQPEELLTEAETDEDAITELVNSQIERAFTSVPELWRKLVDVEKDLSIEAVALGISSFRKETKLHVVPIVLECGTFDFDRSDRVYVERLSKRGWRRIGLLDVSSSNDTTVFIDAEGWLSASGNLVDSDQRLRFQSHMEQANIDRRVSAVSRILERRSAVRNLIDYFNPDSNAQVKYEPIYVDVEEIRTLYGFNQSQAEAFADLFRIRPLGLLQGPPGTGKTLFIGALIHYALTKGYVRNVLLSSQSHEAVNNAAEAVLKLYPTPLEAPSIIRVGHEPNVSERLLPFHVARVEQLYKDKFQATLNDRLLTSAKAIGIPLEVASTFTLLEITVRPVVEQINRLAEDKEADGAVDRIHSLLGTLETLNIDYELGLEISEMRDLPYSDLLDRFFHTVAGRNKCSLDNVAKFRAVARLTRDIIGSVSTAERSFETFLAGTRQIVAGTCVGLGRSSLGLTSTVFDLVVIDEAARSTASELAVPMQAGRWVVLVGDQEQLEPRFKENVVSTVVDATGFAANEIVKSDFERVFESPLGKQIGRRITTQYRMLPPIGRVVSSAFYDGDLEPGRETPKINPEVFPDSLKHPLTWVYTDELKKESYQKPEVGKSRKSLTNPKEIELIMGMILEWDKCIRFVQWLEGRENPDHAIGVICTYGAQASALRNKLRVAGLSNVMRHAIKIDTVDSYQGKENLIVILSLVRNNADGSLVEGEPSIRPGFMGRPNRINVAVSRAMDRLIIVGAKQRWASGGPMANLIEKFNVEVETGGAVFVEAEQLLEQQRAALGASAQSFKARKDKKVVS